MPQPLWTLRQIADDLGIPESTVRYYRDQFEPYVPAVGRARRRRYPDDAVTVLRFIAEAYASGQQRDDIAVALAEMRGEAPREPARRPTAVPMVRDTATAAALDQLLAGESQRQEALWQLAQQVSRIGEALEQQQAALGLIVQRLEGSHPALPPPDVERRAQPPGPEPEALAALKKELQTERELVERLRRAKLEMERQLARARMAAAEQHGARPSGIVSRLLGRDRAPE